jgi:hypothetical protein
MLGLPKVPITVSTPLPDFIFKSITLKTIHGNSHKTVIDDCDQMVKR